MNRHFNNVILETYRDMWSKMSPQQREQSRKTLSRNGRQGEHSQLGINFHEHKISLKRLSADRPNELLAFCEECPASCLITVPYNLDLDKNWKDTAMGYEIKKLLRKIGRKTSYTGVEFRVG